jgi:uncharacterized protein with GYD domain
VPLYLCQAAYTPESLAAQIKEPRDRLEVAARPVTEAVGGRLLAGGYAFGDDDVVILYEAPDDTAAAVAPTAGAGGALKAAKTTKLLSGPEWIDALRKAQGVAPQYRPAR